MIRRWTAAAAIAALLCVSVSPGPRAQTATTASMYTPMAKYWLRLYPLVPYGAFWHLTLGVPSLDKAIPKLTAALKKNGAEPVIPIGSEAGSKKLGYQQLSYKFPVSSGDKILASIRKIGTIELLKQEPSNFPGAFEEAQDKLNKIKAEAAANRDALQKMPSIAALVSELEDHLQFVARVHEEGKDRVLLNMEIFERPSAK